MSMASCLYFGEVGHQRLLPVRHDLRYRVYNFFVDVDELPQLSRRLRFFGYNRFNLFSIVDKDHGIGDGTPLAQHVWQLARQADTATSVRRIFMFCYPRVLGYVFNPLTVYYGLDSQDQIRLTIYEVNNTFGERHSYVLPATDSGRQHCEKRLYVSPFNKVEGTYHFLAAPPGDQLKLTVALTTSQGHCLKAWFVGKRMPLTDWALFRSFFSLPLQPLKVIGGIHFEAIRLWLKGLRLKPRPRPPRDAASFAPPKRHGQ